MTMNLRRNSAHSLLLLSSSFLLFLLLSFPLSQAEDAREALEIDLGYSPVPAPVSECSPPPPPPPPPPVEACPTPEPPKPSPPKEPKISYRVAMIAPVVQRFKARLAHGPKDVLKTWEGKNVCKYKGFSCANLPDLKREKAVSGVDFNGYGFVGKYGELELDGFLDELADITFFHANSNNFTGSLPDINVKKKIRFFYELDLSNNKLQGTFPKEVLTATNLTFVDLRYNGYVGALPPELFTLDVLVIFVNNNNFTGEIPHNLGRTPAKYLTFANNKFTGPIPRSIGDASENLTEVLFLNNKLTGCLPYEIGKLKKMTFFDASGNCIHGPIPQSFGCLQKIRLVNLARNRLFGAIPESLCKLGLTGNLQNLTLAENYITQVGPVCRKLIHKKYLDVDKNCILDLPNQRSKEECEKFFSKKLTCLDEKWMNYIPCQNKWYQGEDYKNVRHLLSADDGEYGDGARPLRSEYSDSVTYAALKPKSRKM